jgi:hypothetical protein
MKLFDSFQKYAICIPNNGNTDLLWTGNWAGQKLQDKYPQLYSFSRKPKCSIRFFLEQEIERIFSLPLSSQAARQLEDLEVFLESKKFE